MKNRAVVGFVAMSWLVSSILHIGCSGEEKALCAAGETRECVGPGACRGGQVCLPDGSGFTECDCSEASGGHSNSGAAGMINGGSSGSPSLGGFGGATGGSAGTKGGSSGANTGGGGTGGVVSACESDADADGLSDSTEGSADTDGDGTPDYLDTDSDNDTLPDALEAQARPGACAIELDSDGDGVPNQRDTDSDDNGIDDAAEIYADGSPYTPGRTPADTDTDGTWDVYDDDNDGDTLLDTQELLGGATVDTDRDGTADHLDVDSDGDTIADRYELFRDPDGDGLPSFRDLDSDADGLQDGCEAGPGHQLNEPPADSDADGVYDFEDVDSDNDGLRDGLEDLNLNCSLGVGETDRIRADTDGDGATDLVEVELGSNPTLGASTPQSLGKYYVLVPFQGAPLPAEQNIVFDTSAASDAVDVRVRAVEPAVVDKLSCGSILVDPVREFVGPSGTGEYSGSDGRIEVNASGSENGSLVEDPTSTGVFCEVLPTTAPRDTFYGPKGNLLQPDSINESVSNVTPGQRLCYRLVVKQNTVCPTTDTAQITKMALQLWARPLPDGVEAPLGPPHEVLVVIPPGPTQ